MILNNGRNAFAYLNTNTKRGLKALDGTVNNNNTSSNVFSTYWSYVTLLIGNGNTPTSANDYALESEITENVTVTVVSRTDTSVNRTYDNASLPLLFLNTIVSNDGTDDIEVKELGILIKASATATNDNKFLLTRKVLSDTLVFEAGKSYQIRVEIN